MPRPKRVSVNPQFFAPTAHYHLTEKIGLKLNVLNKTYNWNIRPQDISDVFHGLKEFTQDEIDNILIDLRRVLYGMGYEDIYIDEWIYWPDAKARTPEEIRKRAHAALQTKTWTEGDMRVQYWLTPKQQLRFCRQHKIPVPSDLEHLNDLPDIALDADDWHPNREPQPAPPAVPTIAATPNEPSTTEQEPLA